MKNFILGIAACAFASATVAGPGSPYVGQEAREIKALSQQEVEDYLNGSGLGYAKAAELNRYPGPRHVLDMAEDIALTEEQAARTQAIFDAMKTQAITLGQQLVDQERELDRAFASGSIDPASLSTFMSNIGTLQAKIRYVHLNAHLEQAMLLTERQIHLYDQLRGYGLSHGREHKHSH